MQKNFYEIGYGSTTVVVCASNVDSAFNACPPFMSSDRYNCSLSITLENPYPEQEPIQAE